MTLRITKTIMVSDVTPHIARQVSADGDQWRVSWCLGRTLDYNGAIIAMKLAEALIRPYPDKRAWAHIRSWAHGLGMSPYRVRELLRDGRSK